MKRWMIWAILSLFWGADGMVAAFHHDRHRAVIALEAAVLFAVIARIVSRSQPRGGQRSTAGNR